MNILLISLLVVVGVGLLLAEVFFFPGFGISGIASFLCLAGATVAAYILIGALAGHITLAATIIACILAIWVFLKQRTLDRMALKTDITSKVDLMKNTHIQVGNQGICISRLAPMGKVRIGNIEIEAKSQDAFLDEATPIEVIAIDGNKVIVREYKN